MDELCQLICEYLFCLVELAALPLVHLVNLLERQESEHTDALENIAVRDISPILIELIGRGLLGVEPNGVARGFAHLMTLGVGKESYGHCVSILAELLAYELGSAEHVAPLIVAAELHVAAVVLEQIVEIVALHYHIVELKETQTLFHALLIALGTKHIVDGEAGADLAQKFDIIKVEKPIGVVHHLSLALAEVDKTLHLASEALGVVIDILAGEHLSHVGASRGVAYHCSAAADKSYRLVASHLQSLHERKSHEMTCREAVCGAVKTNIECSFAAVYHLSDFRLVRHLRDKSARNEFFINSHSYFSFHFVHKIKKSLRTENRAEGELPRYHLCSLLSESQEHCAQRITHACGSTYYNCSASQLGDVFRRHAASPHSARRLSLPA